LQGNFPGCFATYFEVDGMFGECFIVMGNFIIAGDYKHQQANCDQYKIFAIEPAAIHNGKFKQI
jgi:hypothetical protein